MRPRQDKIREGRREAGRDPTSAFVKTPRAQGEGGPQEAARFIVKWYLASFEVNHSPTG
jgi:hypothetical protein